MDFYVHSSMSFFPRETAFTFYLNRKFIFYFIVLSSKIRIFVNIISTIRITIFSIIYLFFSLISSCTPVGCCILRMSSSYMLKKRFAQACSNGFLFSLVTRRILRNSEDSVKIRKLRKNAFRNIRITLSLFLSTYTRFNFI